MKRGPLTGKAALWIVLVSLSSAASAAAFGYAGSSVASKPLSGRVPGVAVRHPSQNFLWSGSRYRIVVGPALHAGAAGWISLLNAGYSIIGGGGGGFPTKGRPFFGVNALMGRSRAPAGDVVDYVLTGPEVAAVRVGSLTIRTLSDRRLPAGDRAAVFFRRLSAPPVLAVRMGILLRHHRLRVVPLDAAGHVIPALQGAYLPSGAVEVVRPRYWQSPGAVGPNLNGAPYHGPTHPLPGACELAQHGMPDLVPASGHVIRRIRPVRGSEGEVFLSCIDTEYVLHGWRLFVAVLLDGAQPGQVLGPIPGALPVPGHPGVVNAADSLPLPLTAKKVGHAWLVVQGGASLTQQLEVLAAIKITKLSLPS